MAVGHIRERRKNMDKTFEFIPNRKEVVSSFRGVIAENIKEIRRNVDRKIARNVLDQIKKEEVFQQIAEIHRKNQEAAVDNQHMVRELLKKSSKQHPINELIELTTPKEKRKIVEAGDLVEQVIISEKTPQDIDQNLDNITYSPIKSALIEAKKSSTEVAENKKKKRQDEIAKEEKYITEITQLQDKLKRKIEDIQGVYEKSEGFSNVETLLKHIDVFPENIKITIQELMQETTRKKVEQILYKLTGWSLVNREKKIVQIANHYLSSLHSEMQALEKRKDDHVSKKLSLESSSDDKEFFGSIIKNTFRKKIENELESEKKKGLEGVANLAVIIDKLERSDQFAEQLVEISEQASLFAKKGEATNIAMQSEYDISKELEEANNKRRELQEANEEIVHLENLMTQSQSPEEIENIAGKINIIKQKIKKLSGDVADKEKLVASIVGEMADKITGKASSEGLKKMANEFERVVKACDLLSKQAFGISIDELSQNLSAIRESIAESREMARETIVSEVNNEIKKAIGKTPIPQNKEDEKRGAFNTKLMEEYLKKGGGAVEFLLQYSERWYCTNPQYSGERGTKSYITDLKLNKRLPQEFIMATRDKGYNYNLLRLDMKKTFYGNFKYINPTTKSIFWLPISKELALNRAEDLRKAFEEYRKMTSSNWSYLKNCDRHYNEINVVTKIHPLRNE